MKASYIPPREQRELRDLMRYRTKIIRNITSEKNWIIQVLEDCNVKLSSVVNSTQGVISTKHIEKLCEKETITISDIDHVYHWKKEASKEDFYETCLGPFGRKMSAVSFFCQN